MSDADNSSQSIDPADAAKGAKPDNNAPHVSAAILAELERLLGTARAAAAEAERLQQAASKSATDSELARTKAAEHLREMELKLETAENEAATIKSLAKTIEARSVSIDDGAKLADEARTELVAARQAVGELKGQIELDGKKAAEDSSAVKILLDELTTRRTELAPLSEEIGALRAKALDASTATEKARDETALARDAAKVSAEAAATSSKNVEDGKVYIEGERTKAEQHANDANAKLAETTKAAEAAQNLLGSIGTVNENTKTILADVKTAAAAVQQVKEAVETDRQATEKLAKTADSVQERVNGYEAELTRLRTEFSTMHSKIETLLPGAASAGLAAAFHRQRGEYAKPRTWWNILFFSALGSLIAIGIVELQRQSSNPAQDYHAILLPLLSRTPIVIALVWLALHAGSKARIANQIQEDYAFKEVVSQSFEGYKKEFAALERQISPDSPLGTLCTAVVSIVATTPSRVYDKHAGDPTPMSTVAEAAKQLTAATKEVKSSISPLK